MKKSKRDGLFIPAHAKTFGPRTILAVMAGIIMLLSFSHAYAIAKEMAGGDAGALYKRLSKITGERDSVIVGFTDGREIALRADQMLVPASILKVLTSLAAIKILGETYRFKTEFYQSSQGDLIIKGYGDPLLVSEEIEFIAEQLARRVDSIRDLVLDSSYFSRSLAVPGRRNTPEPYDAPNGALCVNFNTVHFQREGGHWVSAEPQTPLLPMIIPRIEASGLVNGRITMAANDREGLQYAGELFRHFFIQKGIKVNGAIKYRKIDPGRDRLIWTHESRYPVLQVVERLLEYSNNFTANQLLLTMGAAEHGSPATLEKGVRALTDFCLQSLHLKNVQLVEGSGLAHENRISARAMLTVLDHFFPYRHLMPKEGRQHYKTGTLWNVSTRAGYLESGLGGPYRFVIMRNSKGKNAKDLMALIEYYLK